MREQGLHVLVPLHPLKLPARHLGSGEGEALDRALAVLAAPVPLAGLVSLFEIAFLTRIHNVTHTTTRRTRVAGCGLQLGRPAGVARRSRYTPSPALPNRKSCGSSATCGAAVGSAAPSTCRQASNTSSFEVQAFSQATSW